MSSHSLLLMDVGNTGIKIGLASPEALGPSFTLPTDARETADSLGLKLREICRVEGLEPSSVQAVAVSTVVPPLGPVIAEAADRYFGRRAWFVPGDLALSIENRYERPQEVGADRLVTAFAARRLLEAERIVVIDFGTATTFDCIRGNAYLGGLICPGVLSSARALAGTTAKLPQIDLRLGEGPLQIGRSTASSLNQGLIHGFAAMAEGLAARLGESLGGEVRTVATGGLAPRIAAACAAVDEVSPDLLLEGLRLAWVERRGG
jgi:type III pantothenate kinase